jgi:outer membrane protein assembly factor BamB
MFFGRLTLVTRVGVLTLLLIPTVLMPRLLAVEGLMGEGMASFNWRWQVAGKERSSLELASAAPIDLTRTTPHDFAQFMGPQRLGVLPNVRLARDWKTTPPREVWRRRVGLGWGAFAVVGDYAVTQEQYGGEECVICYRLADGQRVWVHTDEQRFDSSLGGVGPRATPTVDRGKVYTVGATGLLNCLDGATGRPLWSVNFLKDHGAENISHGVCGSPLVVDDWVYVSPTGSHGPTLAAYHKETGQRGLVAGSDQASYSSPLLTELAGVRQFLVFTAAGVAGYEAKTGQTLWTFPWTNDSSVNSSQPIPHAGGPDQVFVGTGYGKGSALFRVERAPDDHWTTHTLWEKREMRTKFTTAVLHDGFLYGLDDGVLACVDLQTGKRRWRDGRYQHGQVLLVGELLLVQAENGRVYLIEPSPEGLRELGWVPALNGKTWNNPVVAGKYLLVRNDQEAACYELALE